MDGDDDDDDESGGIELGAEERKEMIMNLRGEQTGSILDHRRQRANWWGIGARSMCPPRLFRDGAPCRRTRLVRPPSFLVTAGDEQVLVEKLFASTFHDLIDAKRILREIKLSATSAHTRTSSRSRTFSLCLPTRPTSRFPLRLLSRPCLTVAVAPSLPCSPSLPCMPPLAAAGARAAACHDVVSAPQHPPHPQQRSEIFS